jgi:hypothetical protein
MRVLHAEGLLAKRSAGDLPDSWLRSAKARQLLRDASRSNRIHQNDGTSKKTGANKRGYAPLVMEHKRTQSEHQESGSITFYETRGVRDASNVFLFGDFDETLSLGNYSGGVEAGTHARLCWVHRDIQSCLRPPETEANGRLARSFLCRRAAAGTPGA